MNKFHIWALTGLQSILLALAAWSGSTLLEVKNEVTKISSSYPIQIASLQSSLKDHKTENEKLKDIVLSMQTQLAIIEAKSAKSF